MNTTEHIEHLRTEAARFAVELSEAAAAGHLGTTVVTCPDWSVRQLAEHVGGLFRWSTRLVDGAVVAETWRSQMAIDDPTTDDDVADWFVAGTAPMLDAFTAAPGDRRVWAWGADPHARFWPRRMLHETVVHLADLRVTVGRPPVVDAALAVDGVDEFLSNLACTARWGAPVHGLRGDGETLLLRASDTGDSWRVRFEPTGWWWDRGDGPTDAEVAATAADLYLFVQGRRRRAVAVIGRDDLVARWTGAIEF